MGKGRTGAIRQNALKRADLNAMEKHGKRLDAMSRSRRVRDVPPLVYGSLDIAEARDKWMEGVQQQGKTEALHMIVQFPTRIANADSEKTQRQMLKHAVKFANKYHGGDAVFAARLDRDEKGRHTVDVFLMPRYQFTYKDGRTQTRASVSKFSKERAQERSGKAHPWAQGSALQDSWFEYLQEIGVKFAERPKRKEKRSKDRMEPELYGLRQDEIRFNKYKAKAVAKVKEIKKEATALRDAAKTDREAAAHDLLRCKSALVKAEAAYRDARNEKAAREAADGRKLVEAHLTVRKKQRAPQRGFDHSQ